MMVAGPDTASTVLLECSDGNVLQVAPFVNRQ